MTAPTDLDVAGILGPYRAELDRCDAVLLDCLRDRLAIIQTISKLKHRHAIPVMQHGRVSQIQQKIAAYGAQNGVSGDFLRQIYDLIITEACRLEEQFIAQSAMSEKDHQK